jgi:hypothetical protein
MFGHKSALPSHITSGVAILPCDDCALLFALARHAFYTLSHGGAAKLAVGHINFGG